jgi:predicted molibdopterin-dependent oxidoreductase YjgC
MGISQSTHGCDNTLTLTNLALLCGQIGRPGTGLNPLRGQNNVQGCSDSGGLPGVYTAYQPVTDAPTRLRFEAAWQASLPTRPGLTATEMVDGILSGAVKGWFLMGENPLMSEPHLQHAREAVQQLEYLVAQDIFMNETNAYADVILPAASFAEKDGTFTNSDRRVQRVRKALDPPGDARPDWTILSDLARRCVPRMRQPASGDSALVGKIGDGWGYEHPSQVWDEMRALTPDFAGISYERLDAEGGVHWPCPAPDHPGTPYLFAESFPRGRGKFFSVEYGTQSELPDEAYPFVLSTGRVLFQWHGGTMTRVSALDEAWPEATAELHPTDASRLGLGTGDWVEIASRRGSITCRTLVTGRSPAGTVFIPFHFAEAAANVLTDNRLDERAKIPDYKVCAVRIERAAIPPDRPGTERTLTDRGAIKDPLVR